MVLSGNVPHFPSHLQFSEDLVAITSESQIPPPSQDRESHSTSTNIKYS